MNIQYYLVYDDTNTDEKNWKESLFFNDKMPLESGFDSKHFIRLNGKVLSQSPAIICVINLRKLSMYTDSVDLCASEFIVVQGNTCRPSDDIDKMLEMVKEYKNVK